MSKKCEECGGTGKVSTDEGEEETCDECGGAGEFDEGANDDDDDEEEGSQEADETKS